MKLVAFSGGKDSTALAYRLAELGESFSLLFTPTGNELPAVTDHVNATAERLGVDLLIPKGPKLLPLIGTFNALPNHRQRWCTRLIKIEPCKAFLLAHPGSELLVGLRADEESREGGVYGEIVKHRYPLREWGWGLQQVKSYLRDLGITIPKRTDCAFCYGQRLTEWFALWRDHPELWKQGEALEAKTGRTFRSPSRDTWPVSLAGLREAFESGRVPRGQEAYDDESAPCRVCRLLARTERFRAFAVGGTMFRMLDLFSGLGGASQAMRERGWSVDRVEINARLCPERVWDDVRTFHPAGSYDLVWASPPCTEFARESMPWIRTGRDPSLDLVREAQRIIGEAKPRFWVIENVRGSLKWLRPLLGEPIVKVGACYLWGSFPAVTWPDLRGKQKQKFAGQRPDLRSKVPHEISLALALAIEAAG